MRQSLTSPLHYVPHIFNEGSVVKFYTLTYAHSYKCSSSGHPKLHYASPPVDVRSCE